MFGTSPLFPYMVLFTTIKIQIIFFLEFPVTKDAKTLKQQQQFFLECIDLLSEDVNVKVMSITCIGFIQ
jgi:hypothetical protein